MYKTKLETPNHTRPQRANEVTFAEHQYRTQHDDGHIAFCASVVVVVLIVGGLLGLSPF